MFLDRWIAVLKERRRNGGVKRGDQAMTLVALRSEPMRIRPRGQQNFVRCVVAMLTDRED